MGARLGHVAFAVVLLLGGCSNQIGAPKTGATEPPSVRPSAITSIPGPTPTDAPYTDADPNVRGVAETFVRAVLAYDATTSQVTDFLAIVAPLATPRELDRLRQSPRANLDWRVLRDRDERVTVAVTGISLSNAGGVVVSVERATHTTFAMVRDFVQLTLRLVAVNGALKVADAQGGGL